MALRSASRGRRDMKQDLAEWAGSVKVLTSPSSYAPYARSLFV